MANVLTVTELVADRIQQLDLKEMLNFCLLVTARISSVIGQYDSVFGESISRHFDALELLKNMNYPDQIYKLREAAEAHIPDCDDRPGSFCGLAQNAAICFANFCNLRLTSDSKYSKNIVESYVDSIDLFVQEYGDYQGVGADEYVTSNLLFIGEIKYLYELADRVSRSNDEHIGADAIIKEVSSCPIHIPF
ncbi:hypothetical protein ACWGS9_31245 [Bradyrhizobium sp. Arg314]